MIQDDKLQSPSGGQENTTLSKGCIIHFRIVAEWVIRGVVDGNDEEHDVA